MNVETGKVIMRRSCRMKPFPMIYPITRCTNADEFGTLKTVTFYRGCYTCDDIPGVWVSKDFGQAYSFYFRLTVEGQEVSLRDGSLACQSDLAENLIPRAAFTHPSLTATFWRTHPFPPTEKEGRAPSYTGCIWKIQQTVM